MTGDLSWSGLFTFSPWMSQIICWSYEPCLPQRRQTVIVRWFNTRTRIIRSIHQLCNLTQKLCGGSIPKLSNKGILFSNMLFDTIVTMNAYRIFGGGCSEVSPLKTWMATEQAEEAPKKRKAESLEGPDWTSRYCVMAAVTAMKVRKFHQCWWTLSVWDFQIRNWNAVANVNSCSRVRVRHVGSLTWWPWLLIS